MKNPDPVRTSFERVVKAMERQSGVAKGSILARAVYKEGLACEIECGPWKLTADMSPNAGGGGTSPTPGEIMSMALASCQVITAVLWASKYEVPIGQLEVKVDVEKDSRGLYGVGGQPPHWKGVTYTMNVQSPASESEIQKVLDAAFKYSPMRDNLEHPFAIAYKTNVTRPERKHD